MTDTIAYSDIERWLNELPEMVVADVEQISDRTAEFNFLVREGSGMSVNVIYPEKGAPLVVGTNCTLGGDSLEAVHDQRERFFAEIGSVLTNAPGVYGYTDEEENNVPDEEFTTVVLRHWIYPDGLTQHELATSVIEMLNAATYVRDSANRLANEPDLLR